MLLTSPFVSLVTLQALRESRAASYETRFDFALLVTAGSVTAE